jgi:hypothetical protein
MDRMNMGNRMNQYQDIERVDTIESRLESKLNMYERQIDQLFDFTYRDQDEIKCLFKKIDGLNKSFNNVTTQISDAKLLELKQCITNYYHLELENKRRLECSEYYQFQVFVVLLFIIGYLIYMRF